MLKGFLFTLVLVMVGCATTADQSDESEVVETQVYSTDIYKHDQPFELDKTLYLVTNFSKNSVEAQGLENLKAEFVKKGFVLTPSHLDARLIVTITIGTVPAEVMGSTTHLDKQVSELLGESASNADSGTVTKSTITIRNYNQVGNQRRVFNYSGPSDKTFQAVSLRVDGMSYGKRPQALYGQYLIAENREVIFNSPEYQKALSEILTSFSPGNAKTEKGKKPGCVPRFGYNYKQGDDSDIVGEISKNGAAQKGGLKIGDKIIAIDSIPLNEFKLESTSRKVYESMQPVPVKIERKGKIVRLTMKPQIMCQ